MKYAKVVGTGRYVPEKIVTNKDLEQIIDTSDEWIYTRTGIKERRIAAGVTSYEMAVNASLEALKAADMKAEDLELIIVATATSEYAFPSTACLVQKHIGAKDAMAFDISAACSGFIFALSTAAQYIKTGMYSRVLVVGTEKLSHILNWEDRSTCVLFGDGAGAAVLTASEQPGIIDSLCRSKGDDYGCLVCGNTRQHTPFYEGEKDQTYLIMEGREVLEFATRTVPLCIEELLQKVNIEKDEIDHYILHQANQRIIKSVAKKLGQNLDKFYTNMEFYGNTSAASVAIAMDEMAKSGLLEGKKVVLAGFGAGLTYGACVIQF